MKQLYQTLAGLVPYLTKLKDNVANYPQDTPLKLVTLKVEPSDFEFKLDFF
jgi:hypothetical protein